MPIGNGSPVLGPMPSANGTRPGTYHTISTWYWVPWYPLYNNQSSNMVAMVGYGIMVPMVRMGRKFFP